jgi:hypothetical protein
VFDYNPVNSFKVLLLLFPVNNWLCWTLKISYSVSKLLAIPRYCPAYAKKKLSKYKRVVTSSLLR